MINNDKLVKQLQSKMDGGYSNQIDILSFLVSVLTIKQKEKVMKYCGLNIENKQTIDLSNFADNIDDIPAFYTNFEKASINAYNREGDIVKSCDLDINTKSGNGLIYLCECIKFLDNYDTIDTSEEYMDIIEFIKQLYSGEKINYCYEFSFNETKNKFSFSIDSDNDDVYGYLNIILK